MNQSVGFTTGKAGMRSQNSNALIEPLAKVLLGPLLLLQARSVRRRMPRLPEPEGARSGQVGRGPMLRLLMAGDSAAAGVGAETQDAALAGRLVERLSEHLQVQWRLSARTGLTTAQIAARLAGAADGGFDVAVLSAGVNDVTGRLDPGQWRVALEHLTGVLRDHGGVRHIVFAPLPPVHRFPALPQPLRWFLGTRAQAFNRQLATFVASQTDCSLVALEFGFDRNWMARDGFHPGPSAYALWAEAAAVDILRWANAAGGV